MAEDSVNQSFLWNAGRLISRLTPRSQPSAVIASQLLTKWNNKKRKVSDQYEINHDTVSMCSSCNAILLASSNLKVLPKKKPSRRIKRLQSKNIHHLSKYETTLRKKCQKNTGNKVVLTCGTCHKKNTTLAMKPIDDKIPVENSIHIDIKKQHKNKRKRLKKRIAGLNVAAVLAAKGEGLNEIGLSLKHKKTSVVSGTTNQKSKPGNSLKQRNQVMPSSKQLKHQPVSNIGHSMDERKRLSNESLPLNEVPMKKFKKGNKLAEILSISHKLKESNASKKNKLKNNFLDTFKLLLHK